MDLLVQARTYWKKASGKWPVLDWSICITHIMAQREAFDEAENEFETSHKKAGWNEECKSSPYHSTSFVACCLFWQRQLGFNKKQPSQDQSSEWLRTALLMLLIPKKVIETDSKGGVRNAVPKGFPCPLRMVLIPSEQWLLNPCWMMISLGLILSVILLLYYYTIQYIRVIPIGESV